MTESSIIFVTGGVRSGKSRYALSRGEAISGSRAFVATATAIDADIAARIERHRLSRDAAKWRTVEEPLALASTLDALQSSVVVVVDCLTIWLGNLMFEQAERTESEIEERALELIRAASTPGRTVIIVANEVGLGVHPPTELGRRFADLHGRLNQTIASAANEVTVMFAGLPLPLKSRGVTSY